MAAPVSSPGRLVVPTVARPRVSAILVLYGKADLARRAIAHLISNTPPCYELIVVDNASPDDAADALEADVSGATFIRNSLNVGFSAAVSVGALAARGDLLLLLNSDVFVDPEWLPPLLAALDGDAHLAGVSPRLHNVDGSLQEAGSALFSRGETVAVTTQERWANDFPRVVPYVSAACLLLRRSVYNRLGGLDTRYGRGYFEDVELALELEARGESLALVPASHAVHVRGGSSTFAVAARQTVRNRELFVSRWHTRLAQLPTILAADDERALLRGRDAVAPDRILIVDDRVPHVDRGSGDLRMFQIASRLARGWPSARVTLLAAGDDDADRYAPALLAAGVEVVGHPPEGIEAWLQRRVGHYSAVIVSRPDNFARWADAIRRTQPQALLVVDVEAVYSRRTALQAALASGADPAAAERLHRLALEQRDMERAAWSAAGLVLCVCEEEAAEVRRHRPGTPVLVVGGAATGPASVAPFEQRSGLVFLGGFMAGEASPNADAVAHLVDELMPRWWADRPDLQLVIAGYDPPASVLARASDRVHVIGSVDDPFDTWNRHLVHVVPERFGAGVKIKLIESMACGIPFVTTSIGAQGLQLGPLAAHLVADQPERIVELTNALLDDAAHWTFVHHELRRLAEEHFSVAALDAALVELMAELGAAPPNPRRELRLAAR